MSAPLPVSIVICTYNRPLLLEAAVRSCLANATRAGAAYEIVIADNSREGHAEPLIQRLLAEQVTVPVRRVPAAPPNISIARNAGIAATRTPLVAFLDDDLEIEPGWLDALCRTLDATGADVAIGPVRPRFVGGAPDWDPEGRHFTRVLGRPTGAAISAAGPDKPHGFALSTASSLWRRDSCFTDPQPFDPAFSGGEDFDLFLRLQARGRRFVWCAEAGVWETVPHGRTRVGYYLLRACLGAQIYAAARIKNSPAPWRTGLSVMASGALQAAGWAPMAPALWLAGLAGGPRAALRRALPALAGVARGLGQLLWQCKIPLYYLEAPPKPEPP